MEKKKKLTKTLNEHREEINEIKQKTFRNG